MSDCLSQDARIAGKVAVPVAITGNEHRMRSGDIVFGRCKETADLRLDTERLKVISGGFVAPDQEIFAGAQAEVDDVSPINGPGVGVTRIKNIRTG